MVLALAETIRQYDLPKAAFLQIISVRESDLDRAPFDSLEALDAYAAITGGTLLKLWLMIVGVDDKNTDDAVKHVGAAWALVGSLRACHHAAHMGKMRLPADALGAVDMDADNILQNGFTPEVRHAVKTVAKQAERHIEDARTLRRSLPDVALSPLYLAVLAEDFLQRIKDTAYDPAHPKVARGRAIRAIKLWWADKRKQY